jgi:hypothetical protein
MEDDKVAPLVARVSDVVAARLEEIAAETGVSYHTLYAWGRGRRNASGEHLLRLAAVVRRRAELLHELAGELEAQADVTIRGAGARPRAGARMDGNGRESPSARAVRERPFSEYSRFP